MGKPANTWLVAAATCLLISACGSASEPMAVELSGPVSDVDSGVVAITGAAVDEGIICDEASWRRIAARSADGETLSAEEFASVLETSTDLTWIEEYTCTNGSGGFTIAVNPQLSLSQLDGEASNEFARWRVGSGTEAYTDLTGDGRMLVDFVSGQTRLIGEVAAG